MMKTVGVVLAGGLSTRMGGTDKCLLELGDKTLLLHAVDKLKQQVGSVAINTNSDASAYQNNGVPVLRDSFEGYAGPLAGVLTGMEWAHSLGASHIITVAADTPFFPDNLACDMQAAIHEAANQIAIAESRGGGGKYFNHPTFGLWPVALRDDLRSALTQGIRKVMQWAKPHGIVNVAFSAKPFDPFFNVNTPEDFATASRLLKEHSL